MSQHKQNKYYMYFYVFVREERDHQPRYDYWSDCGSHQMNISY